MIISFLLFALMALTSLLSVQKFFSYILPDRLDSYAIYAAFGAALIPVQLILISVLSLVMSTITQTSVVFFEIFFYLGLLLLLYLTRNRKRENSKYFKLSSLIIAVVPGLLIALLYTLVSFRSVAHDIYEYHFFGESLYQYRLFSFILDRYNPSNGFYFVGLHFPFYSYFTFTVGVVGDVAGVNMIKTPDYFKFLSGYYVGLYFSFFLAFFQSIALSKKQIYISFLFILTSIGFDWVISNIHIDSSRIFFITSSYCFAYLFIVNPDRKYYYILFLISTLLSILIHSFGFILGSFNLFVLFLLMRNFFSIKEISLTLLLYFIFSSYYFINILDNGWIFKSIRFY